MIRRPSLGGVLASIGAITVVTAVVAGFAVTGGPGDARDERVDQRTIASVRIAAAAAHCAFLIDGSAPHSIEGALNSIGRKSNTAAELNCNYISRTEIDPAIRYEKLTEDRIRLCADFLRPAPAQTMRTRYLPAQFPELQRSRSTAGEHCFDVRLEKVEHEQEIFEYVEQPFGLVH